MSDPITGTAAGVPFLAVPPDDPRPDAPVVVAWHLLSPPNTPVDFAAALPLAGLDAWRVYLGLPLTGDRLPDGGFDEVMRLGYADAVRNLQVPIPTQAAAEFPAVFAALRDRLDLGDGPIALVGGSAGSVAAQLVLAGGFPAAAAVLISSIHRMKPLVDAVGREMGVEYPWDEETLAMVEHLDFVRRAPELADTPIRVIVGTADDADGVLAPARALSAALPDTVDLVEVPDMPHALVGPHAKQVDALAVDWLAAHLG